MSYQEVWFTSEGTRCSGWHFRSEGDSDRPVVVMAHGFGGTKDSGLEPFAERFADAGFDVFAFDYRGFGSSEGTPRQTISLTGQLADFRGAVAFAGTLTAALALSATASACDTLPSLFVSAHRSISAQL